HACRSARPCRRREPSRALRSRLSAWLLLPTRGDVVGVLSVRRMIRAVLCDGIEASHTVFRAAGADLAQLEDVLGGEAETRAAADGFECSWCDAHHTALYDAVDVPPADADRPGGWSPRHWQPHSLFSPRSEGSRHHRSFVSTWVPRASALIRTPASPSAPTTGR